MDSKLEKIIIKTTSGEIEKIEAIRQKMALIPTVEMSKLSNSPLGNDVIVSFDINDAHFGIMVEKLYTSGFNVLPTNDKIQQVLEILYDKYGKKNFTKVPQGPPASAANPSAEAIVELKNTGRFDELIKITKLVNIDPGLKNGAKNAIPDSVNTAIDQHYNTGLVTKHNFANAVSNLLKICSDINLKTLSLPALQKKAGSLAISLCEKYPEHIDELVKISNNAQIPNAINIKAISKFWEIISRNMEKHPAEIANAIKNSNLRFLENAYDIAQTELTDDEKVYFTDFRNYYKLNKK